MSYVDAVSNAIAARGNALSQGALQSGQVWGTLAANLGQIPFQAMQAGQRRRLADVETEQRGLQNQAMQRKLDIQKKIYAITTDPSKSPQQVDFEVKEVIKADPELLAKWTEIEAREQNTAYQKFHALQGTPGSQVPPGPLPLPEPTRSTSVYDTGALAPGGGPVIQPEGMQNAFAPPPTEAQQMVHPEIPGFGAPQTDTQQHQAKVLKIKSLGLDPETEKLAIEALVIPPGILAAQKRGSSSPSVALGTLELVSPDGTQVITVQTTRTGQLIETGSGQIIDPAKVAGWTKRHAYQPWIGIGQDSSPVVVNREEIARRGLGTIAGTVPDVKVAETKTPLMDVNRGVIAGEWGGRSGLGGMQGQGLPPTTQTGEGETPQRPHIELGKSPRPTGEMNARTYMDTALSQLQTIQEISKRRPDLVGQLDYTWEAGKRWMGLQEDPDANNLYNALDRFKEDLIRAKEGAVIPDAMYNRLAGLVSGRAWTNEKQFATDMANASEVLMIARERRGMSTGGAAPVPTGAAAQINSTAGGETKVINGVTYKRVQGGWQKQKQ